MTADPAIEAAAKALYKAQRPRHHAKWEFFCHVEGNREALISNARTAISAYLAALPSDREAAQEIAHDHERNGPHDSCRFHPGGQHYGGTDDHAVICDELTAKITAALAAAREAGAKEERQACIDQLEYARDLPEAERIISNGPDRTFVKGIITAAMEMIRARGETS